MRLLKDEIYHSRRKQIFLSLRERKDIADAKSTFDGNVIGAAKVAGQRVRLGSTALVPNC
jgi:hypothetical protein